MLVPETMGPTIKTHNRLKFFSCLSLSHFSPLSLTQNSNNFVHSTDKLMIQVNIVTGVIHFENTMMYSMQ